MSNKIEIKPLDDDLWMISVGKGRGGVHCYLLQGTKRAVVIDTGLGLMDLKAITEELTDKPVEVINTHCHLDHISRNYQFDTVYMHPEEEVIFERHSSYTTRYQFFSYWYEAHGKPRWYKYVPWIHHTLKKLCLLPTCNSKIISIKDGDVIDLGGKTLEIIETPGHSQGSVCILDQERHWLFTGDTVCEMGVLLHLENSCSVEEYRKSIQKLQAVGWKFDQIWAAHQKVPLDKSWLDDYIACADSILVGKVIPEKMISAGRVGYTVKHGRASITYLPDNLNS